MKYVYRVINKNKIIKGQIEAENEEEVKKILKEQGYFILEIKLIKNQSKLSFLNIFFNKVSFDDIVNFTRQIAIMLNAGLTLIESLIILKKQTSKSALIELIDNIEKEIKEGNTFSSTIKNYPQYFSNLYIALARSGEASGKLSEILLKLADNLEKEREFKSKIKGALIYPAILIIGMLIVMFITVTFVLPKLLDLYKDFNIQLPLTTQILIIISGFLSKFWPLVIFFIFITVSLFQRILKTKKGKLFFDQTLLKIPVINRVIRISSLVDATRTLSILIGAGVSIIEALGIVEEITGNLVYQKSFEKITKKVEKGISLGTAMQQEEIFPPILVQMTLVGEQTGKLDETLKRISNYFEMESSIAIKTLTTLIEPTILIFLGLGVGLLVTSVITPIYQLTSSFK